MASATAVAAPGPLKTVPISELVPHEFVSADGTYRCVIQLGSSTTWRRLGSGKWQEDLTQPRDNPRQSHMRMTPAVYRTEPISGETVNGLVQHHNDWLAANRQQRHPDGLANRMLAVLGVEEAPGEVPAERNRTAPPWAAQQQQQPAQAGHVLSAADLEQIISRAVAAGVEQGLKRGRAAAGG